MSGLDGKTPVSRTTGSCFLECDRLSRKRCRRDKLEIGEPQCTDRSAVDESGEKRKVPAKAEI